MAQGQGRPTIRDVSRLALVSKTTVSHVLNGTRHVSRETRERVLCAINELHYQPSAVARSLATRRSGTIGMIVENASNTFFGELVRGAEEFLRPKGYALIVCNTEGTAEWERHYLDLLLAQRVEGIIATATSQNWEELEKAARREPHIVYVDRVFPGMDGPYVGVNNAAGAYAGTLHLIAAGHRKIGIIAGPEDLSTMQERLEGFRRALVEHDVSLPAEWVVRCPLGVQAGREATRHVLSLARYPTALFINNNLLALGALLALKDLGMRCPDAVGLLGFDDHPWAAVSDPPLSVVRQPSRQVGQTAAEILCRLIAGEPIPEQCVQLDCELVVRCSCGCGLDHSS